MNKQLNSEMIEKAFNLLKRKNIHLITAESLTGGLIASQFTHFSGASDVVWGGFVTYNTYAKTCLLGVPNSTIARYGVISSQVAIAMAIGALQSVPKEILNKENFIAVAVTGIAGPNSVEEKPVGTVFMGLVYHKNSNKTEKTKEFHFCGNRDEIRNLTVQNVAKEIIELLE